MRRPRPRSVLLTAVVLVAAGGAVARAQLQPGQDDATPAAPVPQQVAVPPLPVPDPPAAKPKPETEAEAEPQYPDQPSQALGRPNRGQLRRGVLLPASGPDHVTWHPIRKRSPNAAWRRHGTDRLVRTILAVAAAHRRAHPEAPLLVIGDLSRPRGGDFGADIAGGLGHASHQNGLDVDISYPRKDRLLRNPLRPTQIDRALAQDLIDRFVDAGAQYVFVGPRTGLKGPKDVVMPLVHHDDHFHVRLRQPSR